MAELSEDQKKIEALELELKTVKDERDTLKTEVSTLGIAKQAAEQSAEDALKVVTDLKRQLAQKAVGVIELPTVSVGKDTYELVGGDFTYKGKVVTLETLKEDSKLVAELIKEKVSHLRKLEKSAAV